MKLSAIGTLYSPHLLLRLRQGPPPVTDVAFRRWVNAFWDGRRVRIFDQEEVLSDSTLEIFFGFAAGKGFQAVPIGLQEGTGAGRVVF